LSQDNPRYFRAVASQIGQWEIPRCLNRRNGRRFPPKSWFDEAALVKNIFTGEFMPTSAAILTQRPKYII
jgi:hypothetical protein